MVTQAQTQAALEEMRQVEDGAGEWPVQWERLRNRLAPRPKSPSHLVTDLRRAYEEATGDCLGCD
jgi:hypothetical protein